LHAPAGTAARAVAGGGAAVKPPAAASVSAAAAIAASASAEQPDPHSSAHAGEPCTGSCSSIVTDKEVSCQECNAQKHIDYHCKQAHAGHIALPCYNVNTHSDIVSQAQLDTHLLLLYADGAAAGRSEGAADGGAPALGSGGAQRVLVAPRAPEACKKPADREARQKRVEKEAEAARR
jgi:hypothetical protein